MHRLKNGIPAIANEFDVTFERVWRGKGSLAAGFVNVASIYHHQPAPVPRQQHQEVVHDDMDGHQHSHGHAHHHEHEHDHQHGRTPHTHGLDAALGAGECAEVEDATKTGRSRTTTTTHSHAQPQSTVEARDTSHRDDHPKDTPHNHAGPQHTHAHHHQEQHYHHPDHHDENEIGIGPLRNFPQIRHLIQSAPDVYLPPWVKITAVAAFFALATAECHVHGANSIDQVHFHEVGAVDSIADTVLTLLALYELHCQIFTFTPLPLGYGTVQTAHGLLPVPAPATLFLMRNRPVVAGPPGWTGELVTPTAAALIRALSDASSSTTDDADDDHCRPPKFTLRAIGVGAGRKDFANHPNVLRLMIGEVSH